LTMIISPQFSAHPSQPTIHTIGPSGRPSQCPQFGAPPLIKHGTYFQF